MFCCSCAVFDELAKADTGSMYYSFENQQQSPSLWTPFLASVPDVAGPLILAFPSFLSSQLSRGFGLGSALLSYEHLLGGGDCALLLRS